MYLEDDNRQEEEQKPMPPAEEYNNSIYLNTMIQDPAERVKEVERIIAETPPENLTPAVLTKMANYIIYQMDKQEKKQKNILTFNQMKTVFKRETSFEKIMGDMGEENLYNITANDKNILFSPKYQITNEDLETVPTLKELRESISRIDAAKKASSGRKAYLLQKQLIEMRQDQYELRSIFNKPIRFMNITKSVSKLDLTENITIDENGEIQCNSIISLCNPLHVSALLCNYSKIKEDCWDRLNSDIKWLMEDLDNLIEDTLREAYPLYYDLIIYKIDGKTNVEIQELLDEKHEVKHSVEYISALWRNKIPKLLAERACNDWLIWHYTQEEKGKWKKCSRCGQIKLAHNRFFSKNNTSKDGFYSICKECRNKKKLKG